MFGWLGRFVSIVLYGGGLKGNVGLVLRSLSSSFSALCLLSARGDSRTFLFSESVRSKLHETIGLPKNPPYEPDDRSGKQDSALPLLLLCYRSPATSNPPQNHTELRIFSPPPFLPRASETCTKLREILPRVMHRMALLASDSCLKLVVVSNPRIVFRKA